MSSLRAKLLIAATAIFAAACSSPSGSQPTGNQGGQATIAVASGARSSSASATTGSFDPVHVAEVLGPAVAMVIVNTRGGGQEGSGFVVASDSSSSYLVTNNHVVQGGIKFQVLFLSGAHYTAEVKGADALEDIAVLKIPDPKLPKAVFGDSSKVVVGQPVVAIGTPLGQQGSVTSGIISAVHRTLTNVGTGSGGRGENLPDVLQTDAAINPGNSGGPLADGNGQVIGVNTAGSTSSTGIGFAIPSLVAKRIADALIAGRDPGSPYVGVCYETLDQALANGDAFSGYGVLVRKSLPGSPAEKAGLKSGDVIEKIGGQPLNNGETLGGILQLHGPGDTVSLSVVRGTSNVTLSLTLGDRPASSPGC